MTLINDYVKHRDVEFSISSAGLEVLKKEILELIEFHKKASKILKEKNEKLENLELSLFETDLSVLKSCINILYNDYESAKSVLRSQNKDKIEFYKTKIKETFEHVEESIKQIDQVALQLSVE